MDKTGRVRGTGHVALMAYKFVAGNPEGKSQLGRPRHMIILWRICSKQNCGGRETAVAR
jgi:hypothetical protein